MTREEAQRKLERATGAKVKLKVEHWSTGVSSPERRAAAAAEHDRIAAEYEAAKAEYDRIVREHPELQRLAALRKQLYAEKERLNHERFYRKFTAYAREGISLRILGNGDTWEEVVAEAEARMAKP
jgi:hypothetical protein